MRFQGRFATREQHVATTVFRSAARLLDQALLATTLPKWMVATAIIGAGLVGLTVASHVRGTAAPITQTRSTPVAATIVPASMEVAHPGATPSEPRRPSPGFPDAGLRFGFLEFENDTDAPAK
jgi:hypothetical protein